MNSVGAVVARILYSSEFTALLDQNLDLVGIGGGLVFDLAVGEARKARPTDMITMTTGQPFYPPGSRLNAVAEKEDDGDGDGGGGKGAAAAPPSASAAAPPSASASASAAPGPVRAEGHEADDEHEEYSLEHPDVVAVRQFIADIFPDGDTRHYVLKWLASHFSGKVKDELFHVLIGTGANGKSKLQELMSLVMGTLYATTTIKTFTGQRAEANATNSNYKAIVNKRSVWVQEPGPGDSINGGVLKELTGGDKVSFRGLYEECSEFKPQAKFALVANHKPKVPADDQALWRRMRCIRFKRVFKANPDPENPLECQRDDNLGTKLPGWAPALHWYLLTQYYPLYVKEGILRDEQVPATIYRETEQYRAANDEIVDFVSANMDHVTDEPLTPPDGDAGDDDDLGPLRRVEVDTVELCARFTRFVENRRPRSTHVRVAGNVERVVELFSKRKKWKAPVSLGGGKSGWPQWVWKNKQGNMHVDW
jgi:P4 family phage/plasmid primase-like protien